jgi:hypothetical protein
VGEVGCEVSVNDAVIRAHRHAAGTRSRPSLADRKGTLKPTRRGSRAQQRGDSPLGYTSPVMARAGCCSRASPSVGAMAAPDSEGCPPRYAWHAPKARPVGRASGPNACSPTGATASSVAEGCYLGAISPTPSPSAATRWRGARTGSRAAARRGDALRGAGGQPPGDGGHSFAGDVTALTSRQTHPSASSL